MNEQLGNQIVGLPASIPVPPVQAALDKARSFRDKARDLDRTFIDAHNAFMYAENTAPQRRAALLYDNPDADDSAIAADVAEKKAEADAIAARVRALLDGEQQATRELLTAIEQNADTWAAIAAVNAGKALTKLATAIRMAEGASDDLFASIGVLELLRGRGRGTLVIQPTTDSYDFPLSEAVNRLREAIVLADQRHKELK